MRIARNVILVQCVLTLASACRSHDTASAPPFLGWGPATSVPSPPTIERVVPIDTRIPLVAAAPPPPITGGTLIATADGKYAVAADPDRDRISIVDIHKALLLHTIALPHGDEPGRLAEDDQGRVHVALRRGNAIVSIDPASGDVLDRREVCAAPRGIAFAAEGRTLRVACASGELVTLPVDGGDASDRVQLDSDLRDVVMMDYGMLVTRFKHAEQLRVQDDGRFVLSRTRPLALEVEFPDAVTGSVLFDTLEPEVAWRTVSDGNAGSVMLHQGARRGAISLAHPDANAGDASAGISKDAILGGESAYGGSDGQCNGVVQVELTHMNPLGTASSTMRIDAVLAVDLAVAPVSGMVAIVQAGDHDPLQPMPTFAQSGSGTTVEFGMAAVPSASNVMTFRSANAPTDLKTCTFPDSAYTVQGQATAIAFSRDDTMLIQAREPASITIMQGYTGTPMMQVFDNSEDAGVEPFLPFATYRVVLEGGSVMDTGHELFHRDAGARIACASCHAEGGDDGHVWHFGGIGARRTQSVNVGLDGTAPFHWSGDQASIGALMEDVFVTRMGGVHESPERTDALQNWLFALSPLPAQRAADDLAALRGKALFEGEALCSTCHNGAKLTNNVTVDVGTGAALQVPSLRGVGYRTPLIHDGCAATLRDRFDPSCGGGDKHGKTAQLADAQIDDLIAYLQTL